MLKILGFFGVYMTVLGGIATIIWGILTGLSVGTLTAFAVMVIGIAMLYLNSIIEE